MFSLEKNYIKEQKKIIESLKEAVEKKEYENMGLKTSIEELETKLSDLRDTSIEGSAVESIEPAIEESLENTKSIDESELSSLNISDIESKDITTTLDDNTEQDNTHYDEEDLSYGDEEDEDKKTSVDLSSDDEPVTDEEVREKDRGESTEVEGDIEDLERGEESLSIAIPEVYKLYIPDNILYQLKELNLEAYYKGKRKTVTFMSIKFFDSLSNNLTDESYLKLYNKVFNQVSAAIYKNLGIVRSSSAESIDAVFGVFGQDVDKTYAAQAISCFKELETRISIINDYLKVKLLKELEYTVVIHTGQVMISKAGKMSGLIFSGDEVKLLDAISSLSYKHNYSLICSDPSYKLVNDDIVLNAIEDVSFDKLGKKIKLFVT